jgi:phospholipid/cholesterol/gamma-HCH transport system permease protein
MSMLFLKPLKRGTEDFGAFLMMMGRVFTPSEKFSIYFFKTMEEAASIGIGSLVIVLTTSVFVGAVTTVQTAYQLVSSLIPRSTIGSVVSASALLELAPTITSLVLAGKVGSNIASQLGTMRVTEQIDALDVMGVNSASYLVLPKIVGGLIAFPCLVTISAFLIHVGGIIAGDLTGEVTHTEFAIGVREYFESFQVTFMYIKAIAFSLVITTISSFYGYTVVGGAFEVGKASTKAVVTSCIVLLLMDYLLAQLLL